MDEVVCKHGWSRRFCEPCSSANLIAQLKGPRDMGMLAIKPNHIPEPVWHTAMSTYHRVIRKNPGMAWQAAIAAAITRWPHVALSTHVEEGRRIILPLHEKDG